MFQLLLFFLCRVLLFVSFYYFSGTQCLNSSKIVAFREACDNGDPAHITNDDSDADDDDCQSVYEFPYCSDEFPYYSDDTDRDLAFTYDVFEEEVDSIINLPPVEMHCVDS
jgi:hypothetical protein